MERNIIRDVLKLVYKNVVFSLKMTKATFSIFRNDNRTYKSVFKLT